MPLCRGFFVIFKKTIDEFKLNIKQFKNKLISEYIIYIMKIKITNYINAEDFEVIINSDFPHKKANIIAKSLYDVFIVVSVGDKFTSYILQENLTYINSNNVEAYLCIDTFFWVGISVA